MPKITYVASKPIAAGELRIPAGGVVAELNVPTDLAPERAISSIANALAVTKEQYDRDAAAKAAPAT